MKLYRIALCKGQPAKPGKPTQAWGGSQAQARAAKKVLCEDHGLKNNGADYEEVEVGTGKTGMLDALGEYANGLPSAPAS